MASGLGTCQRRADIYSDDKGKGGGELGNASPFIVKEHTRVKQQVSSRGFEDRQRKQS